MGNVKCMKKTVQRWQSYYTMAKPRSMQVRAGGIGKKLCVQMGTGGKDCSS